MLKIALEHQVSRQEDICSAPATSDLMGLIFSRRVGTDPYYANYEKSFDRLEKECLLIGVRSTLKQASTFDDAVLSALY